MSAENINFNNINVTARINLYYPILFLGSLMVTERLFQETRKVSRDQFQSGIKYFFRTVIDELE
jgi:hypothetical protein